ncbi:MAG TPA: SlyX family protein [Devosiaceae bacterium]
MTTDSELIDRIRVLEERSTFQERAIEDLGSTITDQWKEIERLKRALALLTDQLREVEDSLDQAGIPDRPPPHY